MCERERFEEARLRAFCEGLEMENIDKLMTGTIGDFRAVGREFASQVKALSARADLAAKRIAELEVGLSEIVNWARDIAGDCDDENQRESESKMMDRMDALLAKIDKEPNNES